MTAFDGEGRLPISGNSRLIIDGENIPFGAYQAIYHKITKKTERLHQSYEHAYEINVGDLKEVHQRISQAIQQYNKVGVECEISHTLHEGQSRNYSSFEKFEISDCSTRCVTNALVYELNFLVILPGEIPQAEEIPQRYKVVIQIQNGLKNEGETAIPLFIRFPPFDGSINATIEYADYAVMLALKSVIDKWVEGLPVRKQSRFFKFVSRQRIYLSGYVSSVVSALPLLTAAIKIYNNPDFQAYQIGLVLTTAFAISYMSSALLHVFITNLESKTLDLSPKNYLLLTKGDEDQKSKLLVSRKNAWSLMVFGLMTLVTILTNVFSSAIYEKILR